MREGAKSTMVRKLAFVLMTVGLAGVFGCATQLKQIKPGTMDTTSGGTVVHAKVVNIVEVKKSAGWLKEFGGALVGAAIGDQIGGGTTPVILSTAFSFVGMDLIDAKYGKLVDRLELEVSPSQSYKCLVFGHDFRVTDKVVAVIKDGKVISIMHEKDYNKAQK